MPERYFRREPGLDSGTAGHGHHRTTGLLAPLLTLVLLAGLVAPGAAGSASAEQPVGGPLLGKDGVVVQRGSGGPKLPKVSAKAYVVAEADSGKVLAAKDPHGRYRPASTLKMLTAIALIPELDPQAKVQPKRKAVAVEGSKVGVVTEMRYRVRTLFRGLLMSSGNDAAMTLAQAAGGLDRTLKLMSEEARRLHAHDTLAKTPNGLDRPGQRTSAYDLALLAREGLDMPAFRKYVSTERAKFPAPKGKSFRIHNHNDLLTDYDGCIGVKTGYTSKAKATYAGAARRDGRTILVTMLHAKPREWEENARALLDWGFAAAGQVSAMGTLVEPGASGAPSPTGTASAGTASTPGESALPANTTPATPASGILPVLLVTTLGALIVTGCAVVAYGRLSRPRSRRHPPRQSRQQ